MHGSKWQIDADDSNELDAEELAELYKRARGEKLSKGALKDAMAQVCCHMTHTPLILENSEGNRFKIPIVFLRAYA